MGTVNASSGPALDADGPARPTPAPGLENGDRLTRAEFERRYEARPDLKKAELIEGVVHLPSPTRSGSHALLSGDLPAVLAAQRRGLAEPAHAEFVKRLHANRG